MHNVIVKGRPNFSFRSRDAKFRLAPLDQIRTRGGAAAPWFHYM